MKMVNQAIEVSIALIVTGLVLGGIGMPMFMAVNTSGFTAVQKLAWDSVPILAFVAIAFAFIYNLYHAASSK